MLNLKNQKFLIETKWAGRRSEHQLLSITKVSSTLNTAFANSIGAKPGQKFYAQLINENGKFYLLLSTKKYTNFYVATAGDTGGINISAKGFRDLLGSKSQTVRYTLTLEPTNDNNIKAYELTPFVAEKVKTEDLPASFKIGG